MEIIKKAITHEKDKEIFFNGSIKSINDKFIKKIFIFFSDESRKHCNILKDILDNTKCILYNSKINFINVNLSREINKNKIYSRNSINIILKAIKYKKDSQKFYLKKAFYIKTENIKNIFLYFADEEYNHYALLETILKNFVLPEEQYNINTSVNRRVESYILEKVG